MEFILEFEEWLNELSDEFISGAAKRSISTRHGVLSKLSKGGNKDEFLKAGDRLHKANKMYKKHKDYSWWK